MTFIPLVAYYLIKPPKQVEEPPCPSGASTASPGSTTASATSRSSTAGRVFAGSLSILAVGWLFMSRLQPQFFPKDLSYLSYVDVWLPPDAPLRATNAVADKAGDRDPRRRRSEFGEEHHAKDVLKALTTFVGGGGPAVLVLGRARAVSSSTTRRSSSRYATSTTPNELVGPLQTALAARCPGARIDVRQLETGKPVGIPDLDPHLGRRHRRPAPALRASCRRSSARSAGADRVRDDWGEPTIKRAAQGGPRPREPLRASRTSTSRSRPPPR